MITRKQTFLLLSLLIMLQMTSPVNASCGKGCISCKVSEDKKTSSCLICDLYLSYTRAASGGCEIILTDNCEVSSLDRVAKACLLCKPLYVLDPVQGKCVSVAISKVLPDCKRYTGLSTCSECANDHYIFGGQCVKSKELVPDCEGYQSEGVCSRCKKEFFLDPEDNTCSEFPRAINCAAYSRYQCDECKTGYAQNLNFYLDVKLTDAFVENTSIAVITTPLVIPGADENCFPQSVTGCVMHESPSTCLQCRAKFFVSKEKQCKAYPVNRLRYCEEYSSPTTCHRCEPLYYYTGSKCERRAVLTPNCESFNRTVDRCSGCHKDYYLKDDYTCAKRSNINENCETYMVTQNKCEECVEDYLRLDTGSCIKKMPHCKTHYTTYSTAACQQCEENFFRLNATLTGLCVEILDLPNCKERKVNTNDCETCEKGFYLTDEKQCEAYTVEFCEDFETEKNECDKCISGFFKNDEDICEPMESPNCKVLGTVHGECTTCLKGYYRKPSTKTCHLHNLVGCKAPKTDKNECEPTGCDTRNGYTFETSSKLCELNSIANCADYENNGDGCERCDDDHELNALKICVFKTKNLDGCASIRRNAAGDACSTCDSPNTHFLEPVTNYCVERKYLDANCTSYNLFSEACADCSSGYYLLESRCLRIDVPNCIAPDAIKNECNDCSNGFYKDPEFGFCLKNNTDGCTAVATSEGFGCQSCNAGFTLNPDSKLCEKFEIPDCETLSSTNVECSTCNNGFLKGTDGRCYAANMLGCDNFNAAGVCISCISDFSLKQGKCELLDYAHCDEINPGDTTKCKTCEDGYFENNGSCREQNLDNCVEYDSNLNTCKVCENLYYDMNGTCTGINLAGCLENNGIVKPCTLCKRGKKIQGGTCIDDNKAIASAEVPNCKGNKGSADDECDVCEDGYMLAEIDGAMIKLPIGCAAFGNSGPWPCNQCEEGWEMTPSKSGLCRPVNKNYSGECIQLNAGETGLMQAAETAQTGCAKCRNNETHYLASPGKCLPRTKLLECGEYNTATDTCKQCKEGMNSLLTPKDDGAVCQEFPKVDSIDGCMLYNLDDLITGNATCSSCYPGFYGADCAGKGNVLIHFNKDYTLNEEAAIDPRTTNHLNTINAINEGGTAISTPAFCKDGYVAVRQRSGGTYTNAFSNHDPFTGKILPYVGFSRPSTCLEILVTTKFDYGGSVGVSTPIQSGKCAVAYAVGDKIFCVSCKLGYTGKALKTTITFGDSTTKDIMLIKTCVTTTGTHYVKKYMGIGMKYPALLLTGTTALPDGFGIGDYYSYDSCSNGQTLVYRAEAATEPFKSIFPSDQERGSETSVLECVDLSFIASSLRIDNCHVYLHFYTDSSSYGFNNSTATVFCLGCKPGYAAAGFGTTGLATDVLSSSACTAIPYCDTSDSLVNILMGGCSKCLPGYALSTIADSKQIDFTTCSANSDANCVIVKTDGVCLICAKGYWANGTICTPLDNSDSTCESPGYKPVTIPALATSAEILGIATLEFMYYLNLVSYPVTSCSKCEGNRFLASTTTATLKVCSAKTNTAVSSANCKTYMFDETGKCLECQDGFIRNTTTNVCFADTGKPLQVNCLSTTTTDNNKGQCSTCKKGFSEDFSLASSERYCQPNPECSKEDTTSCHNCNPGYYPQRTSLLCLPIPDDSPCLLMASESGKVYCLACKNKEMWPVNYINTDNVVWKVKCIPAPLELQDAPIMPLYFKSASIKYGTVSDLVFFYQVYPGFKYVHKAAIQKSMIPKKLCLPEMRQELNCKTYTAGNDCATCLDGYFRVTNKGCLKGSLFGCKVYHSRGVCTTCEEDYFLTYHSSLSADAPGDLICKRRTKKCAKYNPSLDGCTRCLPLQWSDPSTLTLECKPYTVTNCQVYHKFADRCLVCEFGSFLDLNNSPNTKCKPIVADNCKLFSSLSQNCLACNEGFYLDSDSNLCNVVSSFNCRFFSPTEDACTFCYKGYYLEEGKCLLSTLEGCITQKSNERECLYCAQGYYLDDTTEICMVHTAKHCAVFDQTSDSCISCSDGAYRNDSGKCMKHFKATNCSVFNPTKDECLGCLRGYYVNPANNNSCEAYSSSACMSYSLTSDECHSCKPGFYLDTSGSLSICKPNLSSNCEVYSKVRDSCASCLLGFYLDLDTGNCNSYTMLNCDVYHLFRDECVSCIKGYFMKGKDCLLYSVYNCAAYVYNADACISCEPGYFLDAVTQHCKPYRRPNCSSYMLNADSCSSCMPNFYLANGRCVIYSVKDCLRYHKGADRCLGCQPGYFSQGAKCLPHTAKNCLRTEPESNTCVSCKPFHYFEYGFCIRYTAKNCKGFKPNKDSCEECAKKTKHDSPTPDRDVYHNQRTDQCEPVTPVVSCAKYFDDKNHCEECMASFYLKDGACLPNPTGVPNCEVYIDDQKCILCEPGFYLLNNICEVPENQLNCSRYSSNVHCAVCSPTFVLNTAYHCETILENSCATNKDTNNCATCGYNEVLITNTVGNQVCEDSKINNCAEPASTAAGNICNQCEQGYFKGNNNDCISPTTTVPNCLGYSADGVCSKCEGNFLLSKDGNKCSSDIALAGSQCHAGRVSSKPHCSRCTGGFYFDDTGACKNCGLGLEHCALCDLSDLNQCLFCSPGYYMTDDNRCNLYPEIPVVPISVSIRSVSLLFIVLLLSFLRLD